MSNDFFDSLFGGNGQAGLGNYSGVGGMGGYQGMSGYQELELQKLARDRAFSAQRTLYQTTQAGTATTGAWRAVPAGGDQGVALRGWLLGLVYSMKRWDVRTLEIPVEYVREFVISAVGYPVQSSDGWAEAVSSAMSDLSWASICLTEGEKLEYQFPSYETETFKLRIVSEMEHISTEVVKGMETAIGELQEQEAAQP